MTRRLFGVLAILLGVTLEAWVCYNVFVHRLPEFRGSILSIGFPLLFIGVGYQWVRGKTAK